MLNETDHPEPTVFVSHISERFDIWRIVLGIFLVCMLWFGATIGVVFSGYFFFPEVAAEIFDSEKSVGHSPEDLAFVLLTFLPVWIGLAVVLPLLHRRTPLALLGPSHRVNWQHFRIASIVVLAIAIGFELAFQLSSILFDLPNYKAHMLLELPQWALWLLPMLLLLFVQIGAEELLFRGYLLQMIRARGGGFWLAIALPSFLFGLLHYEPDIFGNNAYLFVANTTVWGILLCKVTLRTGNLGAALGIHFANNLTVMFLLGIDWNMNGMALFSVEVDLKSPLVSASLILQTFVMLAAYWIWTRRLYTRSVQRNGG